MLDVHRRRLEFPQRKRAVKEPNQRWDPRAILVEDKASGTQLAQDLKAEGIHRIKACLPPAGADKVMRLYNMTPEFEAGHVFLPRGAPWLPEYVDELLAFPGRDH